MPWPTFRGSNWRDGVYRRAVVTGTPGETPSVVLAVAPNYPEPVQPRHDGAAVRAGPGRGDGAARTAGV